MKSTIAFLVLGALLVLAEEETFDGHTIDEIVASDSLRAGYFDCLMGIADCTKDGEELKRYLPLALTKNCDGCSEREKKATEKLIEFTSKNKPDHWKKLLEKFDPDGIYKSNHPEAV